jgi:tetratricopeptide (TPR) repeat protein
MAATRHLRASQTLIKPGGGRHSYTIWQAALTLFLFAADAAALDRALAVNPNAAHAWVARGIIQAVRNRPQITIEAIERARRLSPFDPYAFSYAEDIALAHLVPRRFEQATRPRLTRAAALCLSDAGQSYRVGASRPARRGTRRTHSNACHQPQAEREYLTLWHQKFSKSTSRVCAWLACGRSESPLPRS